MNNTVLSIVFRFSSAIFFKNWSHINIFLLLSESLCFNSAIKVFLKIFRKKVGIIFDNFGCHVFALSSISSVQS